MGTYVKVDASEAKAFFDRMGAAARGDFRKELELFLEGIGNEFLRVIEDEIIRRNVVDTRLLLNSFHKGHGENVWELSEGDLTLEVGTNVEYAAWVEHGHWTNKQGQAGRWVPGVWSGGKFTYTPGAKTGMYLKQKFIPGRHYYESGLRIIERMLPKLLDAKMQEWLNSYFKA